jgi:Biotin-lipoyl like
MHVAGQDQIIDREQQQSAFAVEATQADGSPELKSIPRAKVEQPGPGEPEPSVAARLQSAGRRAAKQFPRSIMTTLATLAILLVAVIVSIVAWDQYVTTPWTRDGSVRVQVASIAPQVSGQITQVWITDNQFVKKGDFLYQIEPFDFDVTLRTSRALLEEREADLHVKQLQSERRQRLSDLATTPEEQQVFQGSAIQAKAALDAAREQVAQAEINLKRTEVRSPVNGLRHESPAASGRLCPYGHQQHFGRRQRQLLGGRLFRRDQAGSGVCRRPRRSQVDGLFYRDRRPCDDDHARRQRVQRGDRCSGASQC